MSNELFVKPVPLTSERFAPYGTVIEASSMQGNGMNEARFDHFDDLCDIDIVDGKIAVSIAQSRTPSTLPYRIDRVERHPLGSQAFVPLSPGKIIIIVTPPGESVEANNLKAFETNGRQDINYHRGTWHMPLIALTKGQRFLIIDRGDKKPNYNIHDLDEPILLQPA